MLHLLDESLEAFLRGVVPLDGREVDVAFAAPDKAWGARLTRPTVNLFLFEVRRASSKATAGVERVERDGRMVQRLVLPRIELRYLVTAWTTEPRDEHQLLGSVLRAVLAHGELPAAYLRRPLTELAPPPSLGLADGDTRTSAELWSALDGQLKPCLEIVIVLPVDTELFHDLAPTPESIEATVLDRDRPSRRSVRRAEAVSEVSAGDDKAGG
jgi:hypothetical protein